MPAYVGRGQGTRKKGDSREQEQVRKATARLGSAEMIRTEPGRYFATRLKPESTAGEGVMGLFMVAAIWNGIIAAFIFVAKVKLASLPGVFVGLFGLFGLLILLLFLYQLFYALLTGDPVLEVEDHPVKVGQPTKLHIEHKKRLNVRRVMIRLIGRKIDSSYSMDHYEGAEFKAAFKEWRDLKDERKIFADSPFVFYVQRVYDDTPDHLDNLNAFSLTTEFTPPADLPPTSHEEDAGDLLVGYEIQVLIDIPGKPDIQKIYPIKLVGLG